MSYDGIGVSDTMLDSLSLQLREAELRRAEAERAHQVIINYIFIVHSFGPLNVQYCDSEHMLRYTNKIRIIYKFTI